MGVEQRFGISHEISAAHEAAIAESVGIANMYPDAKAYLILDMDDVLFNTRLKIYEWFVALLQSNRPECPVPRWDDARHGIRKAFEPLFGKEMYEPVNRRNNKHVKQYKDAPLIDDDLPYILEQLTQAGFVPIMCLTARDEEHMELSREELRKANLPDLPVFALYPGDDNIADMKTGVMSEVSRLLPGKKLFMIDDQLALPGKIQEENNPNLVGVLFASGRSNYIGARWPIMLGVLETMILDKPE